jgi:hypothetical protein
MSRIYPPVSGAMRLTHERLRASSGLETSRFKFPGTFFTDLSATANSDLSACFTMLSAFDLPDEESVSGTGIVRFDMDPHPSATYSSAQTILARDSFGHPWDLLGGNVNAWACFHQTSGELWWTNTHGSGSLAGDGDSKILRGSATNPLGSYSVVFSENTEAFDNTFGGAESDKVFWRLFWNPADESMWSFKLNWDAYAPSLGYPSTPTNINDFAWYAYAQFEKWSASGSLVASYVVWGPEENTDYNGPPVPPANLPNELQPIQADWDGRFWWTSTDVNGNSVLTHYTPGGSITQVANPAVTATYPNQELVSSNVVPLQNGKILLWRRGAGATTTYTAIRWVLYDPDTNTETIVPRPDGVGTFLYGEPVRAFDGSGRVLLSTGSSWYEVLDAELDLYVTSTDPIAYPEPWTVGNTGPVTYGTPVTITTGSVQAGDCLVLVLHKFATSEYHTPTVPELVGRPGFSDGYMLHTDTGVQVNWLETEQRLTIYWSVNFSQTFTSSEHKFDLAKTTIEFGAADPTAVPTDEIADHDVRVVQVEEVVSMQVKEHLPVALEGDDCCPAYNDALHFGQLDLQIEG